jgi:hypothetical protein
VLLALFALFALLVFAYLAFWDFQVDEISRTIQIVQIGDTALQVLNADARTLLKKSSSFKSFGSLMTINAGVGSGLKTIGEYSFDNIFS